MRLRYAGACRVRGAELPAKAEAIYERTTKTVRCISHGVDAVAAPQGAPLSDATETEVVEPRTAGASARRELERRTTRREERIRAKHPKLGGLILAVSDEPPSTTAWATGALGEERLGKGLDGLASPTVRLLHDRLIPGTRANIDHIAVTTRGVQVLWPKKLNTQLQAGGELTAEAIGVIHRTLARQLPPS